MTALRHYSSFRLLAFLLVFIYPGFSSQYALAEHGVAQFGELAYPPGFAHFAYVNPDAPKRGTLILAPPQRTGFDKFNPFSLKGVPAPGVSQLMFESLLTISADEVASAYGLLAESARVATDRLSVSFRIRPSARFSDGSAVRAADVKHSFEMLTGKFANPAYRAAYADVKRVVALSEREVRFEFLRVNAELPLIVGTMPVFSENWGRKTDGDTLGFDRLAFEPPLASGPYLIEKFDAGRSISYRRNPDWWARDINVRRGMYNFDRIVFQLYKDDTALLEAFKAGKFDVSFEYRAKNWARGYQGARFRSGELIRREFEHHNGADMQGFVMNMRRPLFADVRVRKALGLAFDFEWMNRQLFFDQYTRLDSYYSDSEMAAIGTPGGLPGKDELHLLEPLRAALPPEVFGPLLPPPSTAPPSSLRENLRRARELLAEAGWHYRDGALRNDKGEPFTFEMLDNNVLTRVYVAYMRNLERLGIHATLRSTDRALLQKRLETFDFDMTSAGFAAGRSPGNELIDRFSSRSADIKGSDNVFGLRSPAVDQLIENVVRSTTRAELVTAVRALDRTLMHGHYIIPHYFSRTHRIAYRHTLGVPKTLPTYYTPQEWVISTWWEK